MEGRPLNIPGAKTVYVLSVTEATQAIYLTGKLEPSGSNTTAAANSSITIGGEKLWAALNRGAHTAPERIQLTVAAEVAKASNKIQVRWPYPVLDEAQLEYATIETVNGAGLPVGTSIGSFTAVSGTLAGKDLVIELTLAGTDVALDTIAEDELVQIEQINDTQVGYGLKGVAAPIISANSQGHFGTRPRTLRRQTLSESVWRRLAQSIASKTPFGGWRCSRA